VVAEALKKALADLLDHCVDHGEHMIHPERCERCNAARELLGRPREVVGPCDVRDCPDPICKAGRA
jgi:hypothetical protein